MAGLRALVFDMDGTLIDSTEAVTTAYRDAVLRRGGRRYDAGEIVGAYGLGPPLAILTHLLGRSADDADLGAYHTFLAELVGLVVVYPGIREALGDLRAAAVPLAIFTGASSRAAHVVLAGTDLAEYFAVVVGGDQVARPKPAPDGVELACRRLGVEPRSAGYVGDSPLDLEAARRSGARAIASAWGHLYVPDAPSDVTVSDPRELLALVRASLS
jgi:HAD superfamily hydrolase (TIGR01509 family)